MNVAWTPTLGYDLVAGGILLGLAVAVMTAGFSKRSHQVFTLYLLMFGLSTIFNGLTLAARDLESAYLFAYLTVWPQIAVPALGVLFASRFPRREPVWSGPWVTAGLLALTLGMYALYLIDHRLVIAQVIPDQVIGGYLTTSGPLRYVIFSLTLVSQAVIFVLLSRAYFRETSEIKREQYWWVLAGLSLFYVYNFAFAAAGLVILLGLGVPLAFPHFMQWSMGVAGLAVIGLHTRKGLRRASGPRFERRHRRLLWLHALPLASAALDAFVIFNVYGGLGPPTPWYQNSQFIWRMGLGVTLTYATLKYERFDLDLRLKRALANVVAFGGAAALFAGVDLAIIRWFGTGPGVLVAAQVFAAGSVVAAFSLLRRAGTRFAGRLFSGVEDSPGYVLQRKLAVYRAAVENMVDAHGTVGGRHATTLKNLQEELGLTEREAAILEYAARHGGRSPMATRDAYEPGGTLLGKYRVEGILGVGSFGRTYRCRDETISRVVAVKHLRPPGHPEDAARVLREAQTLGQVHHPNVIMLYDAERLGNDLFLVMEYADGGSLRERIDERGPLPLREAVALLTDVLSGLEAAHARRVIHRDVKPANVLLTGEGRAKLGDFGVARNQAADGTLGGFGSVGAVFGTPAYMSPEQARGSLVDARTDLYAAGALFYECLTGETYLDFAGKSEFEIRETILMDDPNLPLKRQPEWVNAFLERALEKDPTRRFQTVREMLDALEPVTSGLTSKEPE